MKQIDESRCFDGRQLRFEHDSQSCHCQMTFSVYLPPQAETGRVPVVYWLSGLTCTDENFSTKAGAQRYAAELSLALVMPDTSPRGEAVPDDPDGAWDFGHGAGFYINAVREPWCDHYRMFDYVTGELPALVESALPLDGERRAVSGHSMGGHGALVTGLRLPGAYRSISAFSPIVAPSKVPWGEKAFTHLLGGDRSLWAQYDALELLQGSDDCLPILIDQGEDDPFLEEQLQTHRLEAMVASQELPIEIRRQRGYDHSYYFVSSFIGDHLRFHARHLN